MQEIVFVLPWAQGTLCESIASDHYGASLVNDGNGGNCGVLIGGCHIGDCHYLRGNYMTIKRMRFLQDLLKFTGYEDGRLHLEWISAAEGPKLAQTIRDFTEKIRKMGPSRLKRAPLAA